ncbi:hypothetical protein [Fibrella forsythiae]|uniref:DUF5666 domain-containing protein n=1 Tax=Fibrella forsythiae TaxID=2817061 RepID=A0ABS3JCN3_9BACT|nr:hypothetical protein [Fibrella forsythiae]MBO0947768.1 hypothetical protein [Fibrella forsythiae]
MKTLLTLLLLGSLQTLLAQPGQSGKQTPVLHFVLIDSTIVSGRVIKQDSSMVVVRKRNGDLTYLETYQIVRRSDIMPQRPDQPGETISSFSLRDGATVTGRVIKRTPLAIVVRQQNGTLSYIDPGDVLSTDTEAGTLPTGTLSGPDGNVPAGSPYLLNSHTAYTPRSGQVYYRNTNLIRNELELGITNGWSLGIVYNPLITSLYASSVLINDAIYTNSDFGTQIYTRIGIPIGRKVRVGAELRTHLQYPEYAPTMRTSFLGQAQLSIGDQISNVTLGYTFKLGDQNAALLNEGALTIGVRQYLSPSLSFVSDNSIKLVTSFSSPFARLAAALRIHRRHHAFDIGVLSAVNRYIYSSYYGYYSWQTKFNAYPYLGYSVQFGRR